MIQAELAPTPFPATKGSVEDRKSNTSNISAMADNVFHSEDEEEVGSGGAKPRNKSRRELPTGAVATLKAWLLSPEHFTHPYPTPQDQVMLMQKTGIDKKQLKNWFTNARRRIWKPMLKKQLEQGKLAATGTVGGVAVPGVVPGLMVTNMSGQVPAGQPPPLPAQPPAQNMQEIQVDQQGNQMYMNQAPLPHPAVSGSVPAPALYYDSNALSSLSFASSKNIATSTGPIAASNPQQILSKTDSHAVLMELFARDQDLVRQATETAPRKSDTLQTQSQSQAMHLTGIGSQLQPGVARQQPQYTSQSVSSQHPMKSHGRLGSVPTLNSWPHFSSVSSLNNLGTMPGVKSITSLSAADLAKQGPVNTVGNLAQVKSVESMGKNDSYAFLEVFFGDRSSNALSSMGSTGASKDNRGIKRERDEDNDVGLSLEDESPSATGHCIKQENTGGSTNIGASSVYASSNPYAIDNISADSSDTLKRAYDDAMAARGLMSVSRSSEKLTDLVLPAKMQRSLSQEFMRQKQTNPPQQYVPYQYIPSPTKAIADKNNEGYSQQYPAQPTAQSDQRKFKSNLDCSGINNSVEVPSATKCSSCHATNVDTQLRPCGHMYHEKCLKSSLQTSMNEKPKCPTCMSPIQSALLAIPTEENITPLPAPKSANWGNPSVKQSQPVSNAKG